MSSTSRKTLFSALLVLGLSCACSARAEVAVVGTTDNPPGNNLLVTTTGTRVMAVNLGGVTTTNNGVSFTGISVQNSSESGFSYTQTGTGTYGGGAAVQGSSTADPLFMTLVYFTGQTTAHNIAITGFDTAKTYLIEILVGEGRTNLNGVFSMSVKGNTSNITATQTNFAFGGATINGPLTKRMIRFQFSGEASVTFTGIPTSGNLGFGVSGFQVRDVTVPSLYWAPDAAGGQGAALDHWTSTSAKWAAAPGTLGTLVQGTGNKLNFTNNAGTVIIDGTVTVDAGLTVSTAGYSFAPGSSSPAINLAGDATFGNKITVDPNATATITAPLTGGVNGLTKAGTGTLVLSAANAYTGPTVVSAGALNIQNSSGLGDAASGTSVAAGAALQLQGGIGLQPEALTLNGIGVTNDGALRSISGNNNYAGPLTLGSAVRINTDLNTLMLSNTGTITGPAFGLTVGGGGDTTIAGIIGTGTGTLTKDGAGILTLTGANTFTGATTIGGGTLAIGGTGKLGNGVYAGAVTIASGGASLIFAINANQTMSGIISGPGSVTQSGTGVLTLSGANTYGGPTSITSGTLLLSGSGAVNSSSGITINGNGAKLIAAGSGGVTPAVTLTQGSVDATGSITAVTVADLAANTVANGNGGTAPASIGTLTFSGNGALTASVNSPTIPGIGVGTLATGAAGKVITVNASGNFAAGSTYNIVGYTTLTGSATFAKGTVTGLAARQTATLTTPPGFIALTIAGDSVLWTGLNNGNWTTAVQAPAKNWKLKVASTATDFILNDAVEFDDTATGPTQISISDASVSPASTTFNNSNKSYTISSLAGFGIASGTLTKNGTGTATITTTNTYTGPTSINAGALNIQSSGALGGTSAVTVASGGALELQGDIAVAGTPANLSGAGRTASPAGALRSVSGTNSWAGPITLNANATIQSDAGSLSVNGAIGGAGVNLTLAGAGNGSVNGIIGTASGSLTKNGTGAWGVLGANTYTGGTAINDGTLALSGAGTLGSGALALSGGALDMGGLTRTVGAVTVSKAAAGGPTIQNGSLTGTSYAFSNDSGEAIVSARLLGTGVTLSKSGAGIATLTAANTYTGATTITAGTLKIQDQVFASTTVSIASGATLEYAVSTPTGNSLGTNDLDDQNITFTGAGKFVKTGVGNLRFGNNGAVNWNFSAGALIDVQAGILVGAYGNQDNWTNNQSSMSIAANATFRGDEANVRLAQLTGSGTLKTGYINAGTLTVGVNDASSTFSGSIQNDEGAGFLVKIGTGTLTLSGASTYTGTTTINGGTIQVQGAELPNVSGPLGNGGKIIFGGGTLQYSSTNTADYSARFNTTAQTIRIDTNSQNVMFNSPFMNGVAGSLILSDTTATKSARGSLTMTSLATYTGSTMVLGGDLRGTGAFSASTVQVSAPGAIWPGLAANGTAVPVSGESFTVGGLDLTGNGALKIALNTSNPATSTQQLIVNGNTLLTSGTLSLGIPAGSTAGNTYTVLTSNNTITGTFATIKLNGATVVSGAGQITVAIDNVATPKTIKVTLNGAVTPVTVDAFAARAEGAGALVSWDCYSEFQNAGFNVYRREAGAQDWSRVNPALIAGRITDASFKTYRLYDWAAPGVYEYKLESIDIRGHADADARLATPIIVSAYGYAISPEGLDAAANSAVLAAETARARLLSARFPQLKAVSPDANGRSPLSPLSNWGRGAGGEGSSPGPLALAGETRELSTSAAAATIRETASTHKAVPPLTIAAARWFTAAPSRSGASFTAAKVLYGVPGVLRIPQSVLPPGFDIRRVSVQREGRMLTPLALTGADLIVYGTGYADAYTDKDALFLRRTATATQAAYAARTQGLFAGSRHVNVESPASATAAYHDVYFDFSLAPYTVTPWFSSQYLTNGSIQSFTIATPDASAGPATLAITLWSLTEADGAVPDHAMQVLINGQPVGQASWSGGNKAMQLTFQVGSGVLAAGANHVDLVTPELAGVARQISLLNSMTIGYTRALNGSKPLAIHNASTAAQRYEVSALPASDAWVVDARFPDRAALVPYEAQAQANGTFKIRFDAPAGGTGNFLIVPAGQENLPISVSKRTVGPVKGAAYLAVGPEQFAAAAQPLLALRSKEGLRAQFADQEKLFDYYNYGRFGPAAIQSAVRATQPKYLLLLGRTTYDYRDYIGSNVDPLCPTFLVSTSFWSQATSDSMFGDFGRGYPEVAVGRLPVNDPSELNSAVRRIVAYKGMPASGIRAHAVADRTDPATGNFSALADSLAQSLPDLAWQANYLGVTYQSSPEVTDAMTIAANGGADMLVYVGHGNSVRLGAQSPRILDTASVQSWTGSAVFMQATCNASWFAKDESGFRSIAIQALTQPQGGISASIGSSTYMTADCAMEFMQRVIANGGTAGARWGDAVLKAQQWAYQRTGASPYYADLNRTEQILGDPAMRVLEKKSSHQAQNAQSGVSTPAPGQF